MSSGTIYLICAVLGGLNTANAYKPVARDGFFSLPAYLTGMATSEFPLLAIAWQALATIGFALFGAFSTFTGLVGLAVSVLSWVALVGLHRVAQQSATVFEAGLRSALGEGYADLIAAALPADADRALTLRQVAMPNRGARRLIQTKNLAYGDAQGVFNQLDIWRRPELPLDGRAPVLLQIHGGAWVMGNKELDAGPLMGQLAENGWVCVSVNYRLSPVATWPDHIVDVKKAIAWVRANIADHGGDPSFIAVTGGSAGGHLSALAALTANDPMFQPGFEDADTAVQAAVPIYGLYDLTNRSGGTRNDTMDFLATKVFKAQRAEDSESWEAGSPVCRARADAPPMLMIHGTNDSFLPVEQARAAAQEFEEHSSAPVVYVELPRTQHGFDLFSSVRVLHLARAVERFLTYAHVTRHQPSAIDPIV